MSDSKTTIPSNVGAEEALLGSILIAPERLDDARIPAEHFYLQKHRWVYQAMLDIAQRGDPVDYLTLNTELDKRGQLEPIGGAVFISQLLNVVPSAINAPAYAKIVTEAYKRRQLLDVASDVARLAYTDGEPGAAADYLRARITELLTGDTQQTYQTFAELAATLPPIRWLWPKWMPRGMITLLGAVPGAGKSMVALDFARRVIHNLPWPNGDPQTNLESRNVIYIDAEMVPQLLKERAEAWKIDMSKLFLMLPNPNDALDFSRTEYQQRLRAMATTLKPAMIVIDSLSSISTRGENNVEDIRGILSFFNELAATTQTALVLIHHLRKRGNSLQMGLPGFDVGIDDFRGSSHIIAMARVVMALSVIQTDATPNRNGPRKLEVLKSNLAGYPDPLGVEFLPLHPNGVLLQWAEEAPEPYKDDSKQDKCTQWLEQTLREATEPIKPKDVLKLAEYEGYGRTLVYEARRSLGAQIADTDGRQSPHNMWYWQK